MMAATPAAAASSTPSRKGKKASLASTAPLGSCPCWRALWTARNDASTRLICPAPMPMAASSFTRMMALDLIEPTAAQANRRSFHCASVGRRVVATCHLDRSEEHTSELQSLTNLVCRLLLEKKKNVDHLQ